MWVQMGRVIVKLSFLAVLSAIGLNCKMHKMSLVFVPDNNPIGSLEFKFLR